MGIFGSKPKVTPEQHLAIAEVVRRVLSRKVGRELLKQATLGEMPLALLAGCFAGCVSVDYAGYGRDGWQALSNAVKHGFETLHEIGGGSKITAWKWASDLERCLAVAVPKTKDSMSLGIRLATVAFDGKHLYIDPLDWAAKYLAPNFGDLGVLSTDLSVFDLDTFAPYSPSETARFDQSGMPLLHAEATAWLNGDGPVEKMRHLLAAKDLGAIDNLARFWGAYEFAWMQMRLAEQEPRAAWYLMDMHLSRIFGDKLFGRLVWSAAMDLKNQNSDLYKAASYEGRQWADSREMDIKFKAQVRPLFRTEYSPYTYEFGYNPVTNVYGD